MGKFDILKNSHCGGERVLDKGSADLVMTLVSFTSDYLVLSKYHSLCVPQLINLQINWIWLSSFQGFCIISWQIDGETVETVADFIFGGSRITADGDCSHETKRCLLLGRKVMTNLDSILKSRDITLSTKVHLVKAMVFPVVMYGCECWTVKKAEWWRIDAFELWCWRRLLRVPSTARRSDQSILKEISPGCSLEGLMLKLKLQYFGHLMKRADSFAGKDWGQEKGMTEDEMVGWHHRLSGYGFG